MKLQYIYRMALLSTEGNFSCLKAAENIKEVSHDKLTRYMSKSEEIRKEDIKKLPKGGQLIFNDTSIDKRYSKKIEGIRYVWCSSLKKALLGYTLIKLIYVHKDRIYNLEDNIWDKAEGSKNEVIRKKVKELYEAGLEPEIVLFDCGFMACKTVNLISSLGWKYLTLCKSNKIFEKKQVNKHKYYGGKSLRGKARGIYHQVQIAKHGNRYIMTNLDCNITCYSGWLIYKKRWIIGVPSKGYIIQSVKVRPKLKGSGFVAWEAS